MSDESNKIVRLQEDDSRKNKDTGGEWKPDESFRAKLENLVVRGRRKLFETTSEEITPGWMDRNYEEIMLYFAQGHSPKAVAAIMGIPYHEWETAAHTSAVFADLNQLGAQAQLMFFEELRNQSGRGTFKGNAGVTLHALDRQFADTYWGKAGIAAPVVVEEEVSIEQAKQTVESYGMKLDELDLGD